MCGRFYFLPSESYATNEMEKEKNNIVVIYLDIEFLSIKWY